MRERRQVGEPLPSGLGCILRIGGDGEEGRIAGVERGDVNAEVRNGRRDNCGVPAVTAGEPQQMLLAGTLQAVQSHAALQLLVPREAEATCNADHAFARV